MLKNILRIFLILLAAGLVAGGMIVLVNSGTLSQGNLPFSEGTGGGRLEDGGYLGEFSKDGIGNPSYGDPSRRLSPPSGPGFDSRQIAPFGSRGSLGDGEGQSLGERSGRGRDEFNLALAVPGLLKCLGIFALVTALVVLIQSLPGWIRHVKTPAAS